MSDQPVHVDHGGWISGSCAPEDPRLTLARQLVESDTVLAAMLSVHEARQLLTRYQIRLAGLVDLIDGGL